MKKCRFCGHKISLFSLDNTWWSRQVSESRNVNYDNGFYCTGEVGSKRHEPFYFNDYLKELEDIV